MSTVKNCRVYIVQLPTTVTLTSPVFKSKPGRNWLRTGIIIALLDVPGRKRFSYFYYSFIYVTYKNRGRGDVSKPMLLISFDFKLL